MTFSVTPDPGEPQDEWGFPAGFDYVKWAKEAYEGSAYPECTQCIGEGGICLACEKLALVRARAKDQVWNTKLETRAPSRLLRGGSSVLGPRGGCLLERLPRGGCLLEKLLERLPRGGFGGSCPQVVVVLQVVVWRALHRQQLVPVVVNNIILSFF